ncbi:hypothetical protein OV203_01350 [Nannocystis sp. ILAH1]|uniref:hypothetical protein n=1 Tax=Nannocystis sp. ILAH1 TaxID=2996789 RepID=UPI00226FCE2B|nr:hypothetical protein [Nannocystis sp. ILAH1]MCY0985756.1 hypothetical protein [Nannocystis sp. ILAH1]
MIVFGMLLAGGFILGIIVGWRWRDRTVAGELEDAARMVLLVERRLGQERRAALARHLEAELGQTLRAFNISGEKLEDGL